MKRSKIINHGKEVITTELKGIKKLNKTINQNFDKAVKTLSKVKGRVIITGVGKSGHIASKISSTMSSTGTPSQYCSPTDMSHGDLGAISKKDALIVISNSGNSNELINLLNFAKKYSISIIGISSNSESDLIKASDISLILPNAAEACSIGLAPTTSTTMALIIGDALCVSLMKLKKFKMSDYKRLHPGGSLGIQMLQVQDIMHSKMKMPIVSENANIKSVIIEMTKKSFGHVGVKNKKNELIGIITDGDLRRNINKHFFDNRAKMIMTSKPKLVEKNILVGDALNLMNKYKITCLFVVDKNKSKIPIGIIHIHDCLRYAN
jgi:arabinose-5-phosphate isomerase